MIWLILFTTIINPLLGIFVLFAGKKGRVPLLIASLTFLLSAWTISNHFYNIELSYDLSLLINRLVFTFTAPLISILCHLSIIFPNERRLTTKQFLLIYLPAIIFTVLSLTNFIVKDVENHNGKISPTFNGYAILFGISSVIIILSSFINFLTNYKKSSGLERIQMQYFAFGLSITALFAVTTNLILPMGLGIFSLTSIGPSFSIIFIIFTVFAIIRYRLFDIRLLIGKIVYFVLASIPPYFTYFALAYIYEGVWGTSFNTVAYIVGIPVAITFTAFLNFFTKFISGYTDTHLINPGYNPLVVLEQHRQRLSNTLDIEKIIQESLFIIARTIRPSSSGAILISRNKGERWMSINYKKAPYESPEEFKIFTEYFFNHPEKAINYHNLLNTATGEDVTFIQNKHLASQMEKKDIGVIIVLKEEATIRGLLLVGRKEADEPYSNQEIKFLVSIADSMGLALGRALLYQETQQFNEELQQRVHEATSTLQKQNSDLETALAQLEEVRRQEKDMLDVMGHELRTPVSIARNALLSMRRHLQENEIPNPEKLKRYTKMAVEGTRREIALVETLLSTTKLEGNRMEVNLVPMSLMRVIKYGLRSHMDLAEKNRTEIVYNKPEKDIIVSADKVRIQEIMDNFLNNAIKYTGQGKVEITVYEKDGLGWIDVKDTGIGISEENLAHLGKKFFRAQNLYNKSKNVVNPSGTGLGLFVSFLLIDIMKGQKKITSKEGEGSTFGFGLPIYNGPLEVEEESAEEMEESEQSGESGKQPDSPEQNTETDQQPDRQEHGEKVEEHVETHEPKVANNGQEGEQKAHAEVEPQTEEQKSTEDAEGQPETGMVNAEIKDQSTEQPSNEGG